MGRDQVRASQSGRVRYYYCTGNSKHWYISSKWITTVLPFTSPASSTDCMLSGAMAPFFRHVRRLMGPSCFSSLRPCFSARWRARLRLRVRRLLPPRSTASPLSAAKLCVWSPLETKESHGPCIDTSQTIIRWMY